MLGESSPTPETAYTVTRQKDTEQQSPTLGSEAAAQKNMQLLPK